LASSAAALGAEGAGLAKEAVDDKTGTAWEEDIIAGTDVDLIMGREAWVLVAPGAEGPAAAPDAAESLNAAAASAPLDAAEEAGRWLLFVGVTLPDALVFRSVLKGTVVAVEG
jgi:hypothetical protein